MQLKVTVELLSGKRTLAHGEIIGDYTPSQTQDAVSIKMGNVLDAVEKQILEDSK